MAINKSKIQKEFGINDKTVTVDKVSWTPIMSKTGIDRHFIHIDIKSDDTSVNFINVSVNSNGSNPLSFKNIDLLTNEFQYYNGALYAQVDASATEATIDVVVWENNSN